jgi:RHS repeat-associated protein
VQWVYEPGSFRPLAQVEEKDERTQLHYIVTDLTGTARELCSETGEVHWRGEQGLWGAHREEKIPIPLRRWLGDAANEEVYCELRYQGQVYDAETGLYYNRHRYYDPTLGQYISADPIGLAGGLRPQGYVHNPMEWVDPFGLATRPNNGKYHIFHDHQVDSANRYASDSVQFRQANKELISQLETDSSFRKDMFRRYPELSEWSKSGNMSTSPPGMTWHHHEDVNRLVLVDRGDHSANHALYHPTGKGGRDIWGGGKDGRKGKLDGATGEKRCK